MELSDLYGDDASEHLLRYLSDDQKELYKLAKILVTRLSKVCAHSALKERWATEFNVQDDGTSVEINTPFGQSWAELSLGIENGEIRGFWNIWKRSYDKTGAKISYLLATIRISKTGLFFLGGCDGQELRIHPKITEREDTTAYQVLNSIIHLIGQKK